MLKKLMSIIMVSVLSLSLLVGCSSELTKVDSNNTLTQVQDIMGSNYKVLEAHLNDGVLVVKTQIDYSGNWDNLFKLNLHAIEDLALETDLSNIKELQYWSVCQTTDGGTKKTFACTMGKEQLQMIQNKQVFATEIDNMTSKMTDLYLDEEVLAGLSNEVRAKIVINTTKEENTTKDVSNITTKEQSQEEEKQQPKKEETKKEDTTKQNTTSKDNTKKESNTKEQPKKDNTKSNNNTQEQEDPGVRHPAVDNNKEEWCPVCQEWYDPDKETHNCEVPDDYYEEEEDNTKYYGIDGKEQTEDDWNRQNKYIEKGYNGHIDDDGNAYWTDEDGNEYR